MTSIVTYEGELRCKNIHISSGDTFETDAPKDNKGLGKAFSPTDCLATSLASCMLTIMGIKARQEGYEIEGTTAHVHKVMGNDPRRVVGIEIKIDMVGNYAEEDQKSLQKVALNCPVMHSLHPDIEKNIDFNWTS